MNYQIFCFIGKTWHDIIIISMVGTVKLTSTNRARFTDNHPRKDCGFFHSRPPLKYLNSLIMRIQPADPYQDSIQLLTAHDSPTQILHNIIYNYNAVLTFLLQFLLCDCLQLEKTYLAEYCNNVLIWDLCLLELRNNVEL